jgi:ATP-dependent Clp protease adaptor protein ClpS
MSVIRIYEGLSFRVIAPASKNDCRRRFLPLSIGVKGGERVMRYSVGDLKSLAESDTERISTPAEVHETSGGRSDRWAVVVFDDTYHSMDYVIWALIKTLPEMSTTEATLIMLEAHNTGKGVVTLCGKEQALKYRDALRVLQLGCDVQPGW